MFKITPLRSSILSEADWYNSVTRTLDDPESMKPVTAMWHEADGWRGWSIKDNRYFFNDIPENSLWELLDVLDKDDK